MQSNAFAPTLYFSVNFTFGQNTWYQIMWVEGQNVHDQIAFCAFHSCLVEFQTNAGYINETHV